MNTQKAGMPSPASDREGIQSKLNLTLGGKFNGFDVFNHTENSEKIQCPKCNPPLSKPRGEIRLCGGCQAEAAQTATAFFDNFRQHRKVIRLDCYCFACNTPKSAAVMSKILPICRSCANELKAKSETARNNFVERVKASVGRRLKAVTT